MNPNFELFSESRLIEALNKYKDYSPKELLTAIKQEVDNFANEAEQADDITMLALKVTAATDITANSAKSDLKSNVNNKVNTGTMKKLEIEAKIENLHTVFDFINAELEKYDCPMDLQNNINLAIEEIFTNIAEYAYESAAGNVVISISAGDKTIITIEDTGKPYNPLEHDDPNLDAPLLEREIGGLGIFLTKKLMDNVEYMRIENKNVLTITKRIR
jgi:sigma-B regulation protein RsbU (phosphoserine phosphatase)